MATLEYVHDIVRKAELNYIQGTTKLGRYVNYSMYDTVETIDAYLSSKHTSGPKDSLNRDKPFFNIVTAAVNIWYRATNIDRKDIKLVPQSIGSQLLGFVANVLLQQWMDEARFGVFLKTWGRSLARYGSSIPKFIERNGKLEASITPWNRYIADPIQFDALPRIEKFYRTPAQLRKIKEYDQTKVDALLTALVKRRTLEKLDQDIMPDFVELYEVHGELDTRLLQENPDLDVPSMDVKYRQQMHVISYVKSPDKSEEFIDFTLYKGPEKKDPYMITHLIEEDGRTLSIGAVEYLFDAQWMANHSMKNMKDTLDMASRIIYQTTDAQFTGRNVLSAIETGDILVHEVNKDIQPLSYGRRDVIGSILEFQNQWMSLGQSVTSTPDALRGENLPSGTPYSLAVTQANQAGSLFEIMTENKGLSIEDMMKMFIIPHLKTKLKHKKEIVAILDEAGVKEIDAMYIPNEAIRRYNKKAKTDVLNGVVPVPFDKQREEAGVQASLAPLGNKRSFTPDEIGDETWSSLLDDYEWENIKVEVTNENGNKQAILETLSTALQTIAQNPAILQDPNAKMLFGKILTQTGVVSPLEISASTPPATPTQPNVAKNPAFPPPNPLATPPGGS